jgi:hypothetical protein
LGILQDVEYVIKKSALAPKIYNKIEGKLDSLYQKWKFQKDTNALIEPEAVSYRTIQQFIFQTKIESFRVAHRIATDQTFSSNEATEFRLRYRVSAEILLSGQKLDDKEFYFKFNTDVLNSIQDSVYDL